MQFQSWNFSPTVPNREKVLCCRFGRTVISLRPEWFNCCCLHRLLNLQGCVGSCSIQQWKKHSAGCCVIISSCEGSYIVEPQAAVSAEFDWAVAAESQRASCQTRTRNYKPEGIGEEWYTTPGGPKRLQWPLSLQITKHQWSSSPTKEWCCVHQSEIRWMNAGNQTRRERRLRWCASRNRNG